MVGKGRRSASVTMVERKSGYARIGRAGSMKANATRRVVTRHMQGLPASLRRSVTLDNGKELAERQQWPTL